MDDELFDLSFNFAFPNLSLYERVAAAKKKALKRNDTDSFTKSCHTLINLVCEASSKEEYELAENTYKFFQGLVTKTNLKFSYS